MNNKKSVVNIKSEKIVYLSILFLFFILMARLVYLNLATTVYGDDLQKLANNRYTKKTTLTALRGTIFDAKENILAQTIDSYTLIAYLSPNRSVKSTKPLHVVDKELTATKLAEILGADKEIFANILNQEGLYQVEFGVYGKGLTELTKEKIEALNLPGLDFTQDHKRYYPNGDFLSYTLGYTKKAETGVMNGEMGLELFYNDILNGKDGYLEYQQDANGYKLPYSYEKRVEKQNGSDIYLTIDSNIQMFTEQNVKESYANSGATWVLMIIADAKTGAILGTSSAPSFDPNIKDIKNYLDPVVSASYEPGSVMKTYTYMASLEKGNYDGNATFLSGSKTIMTDTISDWNHKGWGTINYDQGFAQSSNVGIANLIENNLTRNELKNYYEKMGFGSKTGITLPGEKTGQISFRYPVEVAAAGFGQGITTTPIQQVQALTAVANNGTLLKPYIVNKIINSNNNVVTYQGGKEVIGTVAKTTTITKIKELMNSVINCGSQALCTGAMYSMPGYDLIGKTGTAQVIDPKTGKYSDTSTIKSFAGMYPKDNPKVIIYMAVKNGANNPMPKAIKNIVYDTAKHLNIFPTMNDDAVSSKSFIMPNLLNKEIEAVKTLLNLNTSNYVVIGDGTKVIDQYPKYKTTVYSKDRIFIITNNKPLTIPNLYGYSTLEVKQLLSYFNIKYQISGYGFVKTQSIAAGSVIDPNATLELFLNNKYNIDTAN